MGGILLWQRGLSESCTNLNYFCEQLGKPKGTHCALPPELGESQNLPKNSLSSVFETVLYETVFGLSPT